jgi:hypothetical protein
MYTKKLKNGAIGGYILNKNGKVVWRIIKGPTKKKVKKGGNKYSPCKTLFFNNICQDGNVYYPPTSDVKEALLKFMNNSNIVITSNSLQNCIHSGIKFHYKKSNKNVEIKPMGKKGASSIPYKITHNKNNYVIKETKIDIPSLTKKNNPYTRIYNGDFSLSLHPPDNKFYVYILSNYETQTLNNLNMMYTSNNNDIIKKNILQIYDAYICKKKGFNLLEIANNGTLCEYLKKNIELKQFANIFIQIFRTLYHLQDTIDFCHNDLKSQNIFLNNDNGKLMVKIADFDRSSSTFVHKQKYYRITNRKDLCFGAKNHTYKIYNDKYFKLGKYLDVICRTRHALHNIEFAKIIDIYFGLLNFIQNPVCKDYLFNKNDTIMQQLFGELMLSGAKKLSDKKWKKYKEKLMNTKYNIFLNFFKILNYKNIVLNINIRQLIQPIYDELNQILNNQE